MILKKKSVLHKILSPVLLNSGFYLNQWKKHAQEEPLTAVICYHRILKEQVVKKPLFVMESGTPASVFEAQMRFMLRYFTPVKPSDIISKRKHIPLTFAVTFDDGFEDNYTIAAPILKRLGIPAAFYVLSDYAGTDKRFWWEQLSGIMRITKEVCLRADDLELNPEIAKIFPPVLDIRDLSKRVIAHEIIVRILLKFSQKDIKNTIDTISEVLEVKIPREGRDFGLMNWEQLRELNNNGFEVGAHTATHCNMGQVGKNEIEREITNSVALLEKRLGEKILTFAYPYGYKEHQSEAAEEAIRKAGCTAAFTTESKIIGGNASSFALPRFKLNQHWNFACAYNVHNAFGAM